jgi:hypothetical protein
VLWGVTLVGITELLSAFHNLTIFGLATAWLLASLAGIGFFALGHFGRSHVPAPPAAVGLPRMERLQVAFIGLLAILVALLALIAVRGPPNTWDSMTYHLARLIHWSQNASLQPYPTHILRQLYLQPGAEFILLHLQLLSDGDHLAGLVQWASMVGALIGTSVLANDLGASRPGALCASIFAASLPIGILESTSTQNDYVVAFWLVCSAVFGMRLMRWSGHGYAWAEAAAFGGSVGLALLTKATAYLFVLPLLLWVTLDVTRRRRWRGLSVLVMAGAIALSINAGFYARNLVVFGSPIGPLDEDAPSLRYVNEAFTPPLLLSNAVRDIGINLNATPLAAINAQTVNSVRLVHAWLGVDIADQRTTWGDATFAQQPVGLAFDENFASNPLHLLVMLAGLVALWPLRRVLASRVTVYALTLAGGFVLFSVVLRWQPWNTRLELPLFVLGAPLVGTVTERTSQRLVVLLTGILLVGMLPWVVYNQARPLIGPRSILSVGRGEQYFTNRPSLRSAYLGAVGYLAERGCAQVGFVSTPDGWEYPLWPLLRAALPGTVEIEHVNVTNASAGLTGVQNAGFRPCAVLALGPTANMLSIDVDGSAFKASWGQLDPTAALDQVVVLTADQR